MTNEFKLIEPSTAREKLVTFIDRTEKQLGAVKAVIDSLIALEGEVLSVYLCRKLLKQFPSLQFSISSPYGWYDLRISGEGFDAIDLQMGYKSEPKVVNIKRITNLNQRYLLDEERLPKYRAKLDTIEANVVAYNAALLSVIDAENDLNPVKFVVTENMAIRVRDTNDRIIM